MMSTHRDGNAKLRYANESNIARPAMQFWNDKHHLRVPESDVETKAHD